jgi:hypothetical protein
VEALVCGSDERWYGKVRGIRLSRSNSGLPFGVHPAKDCRRLARPEDLQQLRDVLPDDQLEHETDWRRIILYYRDRYIRLNPKGIWQPIPEEEFSDGLPSDPPRPIDVRTLPSDLRADPFDAGNFRDPVLVDSQAWGRRVATRSDPVQDGKRKRDDDSSESLEGEPLAKAPRPDDATTGSTTEGATLKEEHQRLLLDLHHVLQQITGKNLGMSKALFQSLLSSVRETLAECERREERRTGKAAKEARRQARRSDSSLSRGKFPQRLVSGLSQGSQIRTPDSKFSDPACRRFGSLGNINVTLLFI